MSDLKQLFEQIKRFQKLAEKTGRNKSSSYQVEILFPPSFYLDNKLDIIVGGFDITEWPKTYEIDTTSETLLENFTELVDEAIVDTDCIMYCNNCNQNTVHEDGKCFICEN